MDPIMKLLEEDEDETMHSGADVDALTAALNRHIEGSSSSSTTPVMSQGVDHSQLFHQWQNSSHDGTANMQSQFDQNSLPPVDSTSGKQTKALTGSDSQQHNIDASHSQEVSQSTLQPKQEDVIDPSIQQPSKPSHIRNPENNAQRVQESGRTASSEREAQLSKLQQMNQQATSSEQGSNAVNKGKQVPFALLLPVITPQLDKEKALQLNSLYARLKKNEIPKDGFVRQIRGIVGDQMLKMAVMKLQAQEGVRNPQGTANQYQPQGTTQPPSLSIPSASAQQYSQPFAQAHQQGQSSSADPSQKVSSAGHAQISQKTQSDHRPDSHLMQPNQMVSSSLNPSIQERERFARLQGLTKQQQQHLHFSSASVPMYGTSAGNVNHYTGVTSTAAKPQNQDPSMRQASLNQNTIPAQVAHVMGTVKFDRPHPVTDGSRIHVGSSGNMTASQQHSASWQSGTTGDHAPSSVKQEPVDQGNEQQNKPQSIMPHGMSSAESKPGTIPGTSMENAFDKETGRVNFQASKYPPNSVSTATLSGHQESQMSNPRIPTATQLSGNNERNVPKKPIIGQKKPLETSSLPLSSKKQKVSGGFLDQSIEQLNDVTAISGVNLREEEEHLFSGTKEDSRVSEASRRVVQEEEERLILQRAPLQKKLEGIMLKCGVRSISTEVERCLSLCVEERMRGLIRDLIRVSKQRIDIEKPKHRTIVTSDVRQQILMINQKSKEEWEKKQAEIERLRKLSEPESYNPAADGDREKEEGRGKVSKANKEEDDKMRTTAANVAARAAFGGDDMLSKWQLMAEQARQKREVSSDSASSSQPTRDANHKTPPLSGRIENDSQEAEKMGLSPRDPISGSVRKIGRAQATNTSLTRLDRRISVKDVIAVLEREPQMSKSPLIYRLYNKAGNTDSSTDQAELV